MRFENVLNYHKKAFIFVKKIIFGSKMWFWLILVLFIFLSGSVLFFREVEPLKFNSIIVDGLAQKPKEDQAESFIRDGLTFRQSFVATKKDVSHIAIGLVNLRQTNPSARVTVSLKSTDGRLVAENVVAVKDLRQDSYTPILMDAVLDNGREYFIDIQTDGVKIGNELAFFYDPVKKHLFSSNLTVFEKGSDVGKKTTAQIGFYVLRQPTFGVVSRIIFRSSAFYLWLTFGLIIFIIYFNKRTRDCLTNILKKPVFLDEFSKTGWREKTVAALLGIIFAFVATFPYYVNLHLNNTMGDVQRNLIFRALGREALIKEGAIAQWDPYLCGGVPLLANIESAHLDPFFLFPLFFGENLGLRLSVTATLAIGFFGMYLLSRRFLGTGIIPSLVSGAIFSFSGFQMLAFGTGVFAWIPIGWIPLFIYFYLLALKQNKHIFSAACIMAFIFLGGGPHMPVFSSILVLLLTIGISVVYKTWRPWLIFCLILIVSGLLSAVKLIPALELIAVFDKFNRPPSFIAPLGWIPNMFWNRGQLQTPAWNFPLTGENYRWSEFGSYVGILPLIIFLAGIPLFLKKRVLRIWFFVAVVVLAMVFGYFPWTLIQHVPVLNEIVRNPQRLRSVLFLPLGVLVAYSLSFYSQTIIKNKFFRTFVVGIISLIIIADLLTFHAGVFKNLFKLPEEKIDRSEKFTRVVGSYTNEDSGYYKAGYFNYLANQGTTDLCVPNMKFNRSVAATGENSSNPRKPYMGEAYFLSGFGKVELKKITSTKIELVLQAQDDGWIIINQNYFPGWSASPKREVEGINGLLAVRAKKGDTNITLFYKPLSYKIGLTLSLTTLAVLLVTTLYAIIKKRSKAHFT
jgi:hypothetical protein